MGRAQGQPAATNAKGLRVSPRRAGARKPYRWTLETLQTELEVFCAGRASFPTSREFNAAGRGDLRQAVTDIGGTAHWAEVIGLPLTAGQHREPYSFEDARADAFELLGQRALRELTNAHAIRAAGFPRLATFVQRNGGVKRFMQRLRDDLDRDDTLHSGLPVNGHMKTRREFVETTPHRRAPTRSAPPSRVNR